METYDIYEVYYHGKYEDYLKLMEIDEFERGALFLYNFVYEHGDWYAIATYDNKHDADMAWDKWAEKAKTEFDEDDKDFFSAIIYVYERTIRDENEEPVNSFDIDGAVELID